MREPKYKVGDVLRVAEPERFVDRNKFRDRDVIVLENLLDYAYVLGKGYENTRSYCGRVSVEFQQRKGRGKKFRLTMDERDLTSTPPVDLLLGMSENAHSAVKSA